MKAKKITLLKSLFFVFLSQSALYASPYAAPLTAIKHNNFPAITAIAAAQITSQPQSVSACPGGTAQFTVVANVTGMPVYTWQKDGIVLVDGGNISGAGTATLTISNIAANDAAAYRCIITDLDGIQFSDEAYLNTKILSAPDVTTCYNTGASVSAIVQGTNTQYQWYFNGNNNSNSGGNLIDGATANSYAPPVAYAGTNYYYVEAYPAGYGCAKVTSNPIAFTVQPTAAGTISDNEVLCPGETTAVSITGYMGTIQWQQSADNAVWVNVTGGSGANLPTYSTPQLNASTYYRAEVTSPTCGVVNSQPVAITVTEAFTWVGTVSTDWNTPQNWSCGITPTLNQHVIVPSFPANQPVVTSGLGFAKSLTVDSGAAVTIMPGASLHVANDVSADAGATVLVHNNAALIQDNDVNNSGNIIVKKDSNPLYRLDYTMWSSPVSGQQLQAFSPATSPTRFYEYGAFIDGVYQDIFHPVSDVTTNFETGKGYLIRMPNTITGTPTGGYYEGSDSYVYPGSFTGVPNNGTITTTLTVDGNRYTAVGNPYPSPISVKEFFSQNASVLDSVSGVYLWRKRNNANISTYATLTLAGLVANAGTPDGNIVANGEGGEYTYGGQDQASYYSSDNSGWIISPGQAFIVRAKEGETNPQLTFNNGMRKSAFNSGSQPFFKETQNNQEPARLWLNLTSASGFSQAAIAYIDGATTGIDYGYDGKRITENGNSELYTTAANKNLAMQARPAFEATDVVVLGYSAANAGQYTLTLDHVDGVFANGQDIYLKDNLLGTTHDIKNSAYSFATDAGTFNNRFEVVYQQQTQLNANNPVFTSNNVIVYRQDNTLAITTGTVAMTDVNVYDLRGRKLYDRGGINATQTSINNLSVQHEVIIVEVTTAQGKASKKVIF